MQLIWIFVFLFFAQFSQAEQKYTVTPPEPRYQIIVGEYEVGSLPEELSSEDNLLKLAETVKKINKNYGVFKLDTITGKAWIFQSLKNGFFWIPINDGKILKKEE